MSTTVECYLGVTVSYDEYFSCLDIPFDDVEIWDENDQSTKMKVSELTDEMRKKHGIEDISGFIYDAKADYIGDHIGKPLPISSTQDSKFLKLSQFYDGNNTIVIGLYLGTAADNYYNNKRTRSIYSLMDLLRAQDVFTTELIAIKEINSKLSALLSGKDISFITVTS